MEPVGKNPDYLKGALFTTSIKGLDWGPHHYQFITSDGQLTDQTYPETGPYVRGSDPNLNRIPTLLGLQFEPATGSPEDTFTFSVLYSDADGDKFQYELVLGDYALMLRFGAEGTGWLPYPTHGFATRLHSYAFASDGRNLGEPVLRGPKIKGQKPKITTRLSSQRIPVGGTLHFLFCRRNKSNALQMVARRQEIQGATDSKLILTDLHLDDAAFIWPRFLYRYSFSNAAKVLIVEPPNIILNPESQSLIAGELLNFLWRPSTPRLSYQWFRDGEPIQRD